jgi:AAA domain/TrwC relaxase
VAVRVSAESGFDPGYMLKGQAEQAAGERTAGGYYINAALAGEAPGRWFGRGAEALGFGGGQVVEAAPFLAVYRQVHPVTGERLGRAPGGYATAKDILARLLAGEPHATAERRRELEREAAQQTRRSPAYTDVTASHDKTISIVHAAIRENERRARLAGNGQVAAAWAAREARWQEILQEGNRRGLEYMQQVAAWTRTGYHGKRVDGVEPGRWERALPVVTTWLQGTNRKGEPHDHSHNLWARMGITESDGKWRALDTMRIRGQLGAMAAVVAAYVEPALTAEFGVRWVARADGMGNEIAGVTQEWKDAFSTRTRQVDAKERQLALEWELRFGREPTTREMLFIRHTARDYSRKAKDDAQIDWDAEAAKWDATVGGRLAEVAEATLGRWQPGAPVPGPQAQEQAIRAALARVQREHSTWTRADLMKVLGWSMGPQFAHIDPDARQDLLLAMTDRALSPDFGVKCLEAPEWPPVPQALRRELDGRSVYTAPGTDRYATYGQLSMEDALCQRAQRHGAPFIERQALAARLGADADLLDAVLRERAQDAAQRTREGLRLDQASMIYEALTCDRRVSVGVGPAGSGKTYTVGAAARAWEASGGQVIGVTTSQAARNVLAEAGIGNAWNSTQFLHQMREPGQRLAERTLVVIDEGSTMSMTHLAGIVGLAERDNAKVLITGDHQQLAAVESGGGMTLLAGHLGHTQLACPVRFAAEWEQEASLRLREGDKSALEAYDEHGRITGGTSAQVSEDARRAYVAARLAGENVLLMAYTREDCRELSRIIRDDLIHLGLVDNGRSVPLAAGARASAGDLIVARENDHRLVTDPGHTLANGDRFTIDAVTGEGLLVRRVLENEQLAERPVLYPADKLATTDLGYAVTGHTGMGGTVARGEAVFRGGEPREWAYVALTRGRERNTARVVTQARAADPGAGTRPDPELGRADLLRRERAGLPAEPVNADPNPREAVAVLADCLDREAGEDSATEYLHKSMVRADHLGLLHARWADQVKTADRERYQRIVHEALPQEWRGQLSPQATWLYRTMKAAELAGLNAAEVTQTAIRSRSLEGTREVASVLDARMRAMVEPLVPLPLNSWSERVPQIADTDRQQYVRRLAEAMDERTERIGVHAVQAQPEWALRALGPVPEEPGERLDWQQRASAIGAYRELYGVEDQADPIGPEPAGSSSEQRAAWHAAFAALTRTDTVDVRTLPEVSLWHMRDSYKAETGWAPPHVGRQLRGVRLAAEDARQLAIRSWAEAQSATDPDTADRYTRMAASAEALLGAYGQMEASLDEAMDDRRAWEQITAGPRRLAVAADSELRRRDPGKPIEPLRSAEPRVPESDEITTPMATATSAEPPDWLTKLAGQRGAFQDKLAERQNLMVPDEDPDYGFLGEAWAVWGARRDAILQPPKPEPWPCRGVDRFTGYELSDGYELPDKEAAD